MATGIDIGRSGVKIVHAGKQLPIMPAVACPHFPIDDPDEVKRAERDTVALQDGKRWFTGETAVVQGDTTPGVFAEWDQTDEYEALVAASIAKVSTGEALRIVAGVPSEAGQSVKEYVHALFTRHAPTGSRIKIVAQPAGALFSAAADNRHLLESTIVVVDVGRYSTDMAVAKNGRAVQGAYKSLPGVRLAVDALAAAVRPLVSGTPTFERLEDALRTGTLRHAMTTTDIAEQVAAAREKLNSEVGRALNAMSASLRGQLDGVVLAGGGAGFIKFDVPTVMAPQGRYAVAMGFALMAAGL
ncbi:ParM/StbA family protein [Acidithiobacillus ferrivorans]|nr:ParM/StbA family protein [Acidithiobacillus ferrivorans]